MTPTLLNESIVVNEETATPQIFWGPPSIFGYTILKGFFTVLAIKEVISVTRNVVKGSSTSLRVNRSILMAMVENWEDLTKVARQLIWTRPLLQLSHERKANAPLNRIGWMRFLISGIIALWLFGIDMALIVLSVPNRAPQDAELMTKLRWSNTGEIPILTKKNTLQGSFSKAIKLESKDNDVEFTRLPSVSLERTDYRDFQLGFPEYNERLMACNNTEGWRIICRVHCKQRYYQYKLRMDVATDTSNSTFFVPTTRFLITEDKVTEYAKAIQKQLRIDYPRTRVEQGYFEINSTRQPDEYTTLRNGEEVLTHDAIATLFLRSIEIRKAPANETYLERLAGERDERNGKYPHGVIAISQRPYLPLLGSIAFYILLQVVSLIQQKAWNLHVHSHEMTAILEVSGGNVRENLANIVVEDRPLIETHGWMGKSWTQHTGYLPTFVVADINQFLKEFRTHGPDEFEH